MTITDPSSPLIKDEILQNIEEEKSYLDSMILISVEKTS